MKKVSVHQNEFPCDNARVREADYRTTRDSPPRLLPSAYERVKLTPATNVHDICTSCCLRTSSNHVAATSLARARTQQNVSEHGISQTKLFGSQVVIEVINVVVVRRSTQCKFQSKGGRTDYETFVADAYYENFCG